MLRQMVLGALLLVVLFAAIAVVGWIGLDWGADVPIVRHEVAKYHAQSQPGPWMTRGYPD